MVVSDRLDQTAVLALRARKDFAVTLVVQVLKAGLESQHGLASRGQKATAVCQVTLVC